MNLRYHIAATIALLLSALGLSAAVNTNTIRLQLIVDTNGVILWPTNFFNRNVSTLNSAITNEVNATNSQNVVQGTNIIVVEDGLDRIISSEVSKSVVTNIVNAIATNALTAGGITNTLGTTPVIEAAHATSSDSATSAATSGSASSATTANNVASAVTNKWQSDINTASNSVKAAAQPTNNVLTVLTTLNGIALTNVNGTNVVGNITNSTTGNAATATLASTAAAAVTAATASDIDLNGGASNKVVSVISANTLAGTNFLNSPNGAGGKIDGGALTNVNALQISGRAYTNLLDDMTNAAASVVGDLPAIYATETATGMVLLVDLPIVIPTALVVTGDPLTNVLTVSASKGNNSTAIKGTPSLPWATIGSAMGSSSPGDEIRVLPGSYPETVEILSNRNVRLEKDVFVGTLGTTNRTGDATNWTWTLTGRGTITNLYLWSRVPIVAACWKVDSTLSFAYEGPHTVTVEDTVSAIALGNTGSETPGRYKVTARSIIAAGHVANTMLLPRLEVVTTRQTNGFSVNTSVADRSLNCVLVSDYIMGNVTAQSSTTQPTTNRLTIGPRSGRLTWTNGQLVVFSASKAGTQPWTTVQNTDWLVPSGSNAVHTPTVGSGLIHVRLRDVYLNTPQVTNGGANYELEPSSVYVTNANVEGWAQ